MAAASGNNTVSVALQTAAATLPLPPQSPRRKHRPSASVRRRVVEFASTSSDDIDDEQHGAERPTPVSVARPPVRNFSVPDPAELQRWKAEVSTSHVRNEHYDSPPISPRTYHSSAESNDEDALGHQGLGRHKRAPSDVVCTKRPKKAHSRKLSAPTKSGKTFASTKDGFKCGNERTRHHERSKSASTATVDHKPGVKTHIWQSTYTASISISRPGVSRNNSVSHSVQTNPTFVDTESGGGGGGGGGGGALRATNIHMVRARQRYGDGGQSYSFSARAPVRVVEAPLTGIDEIDVRENPRQSLRADSWHSNSRQVAMSAPKYCKNSVREKAHSIAGFGNRKTIIDALPYMKGGTRMIKQGRNGRRQMRWLFLTKDQTAIVWNGGLMSTSTVRIHLKDIEEVIPRTNLSQRASQRGYSFALKFPEKNAYNRTVLHLIVHSERDLTLWVGGLTRLVECAKNGHELCDIMDVQVEIDARRENPYLRRTQTAPQDVKRNDPPMPMPKRDAEPRSSNVKPVSSASTNAKPASASANSMRAKPVPSKALPVPTEAAAAGSHDKLSKSRPSFNQRKHNGMYAHMRLGL